MRKNIKNYTILKQIGTGGFGEVYVARQEAINREVAIKVILPVHANRADFIQRFQYEAELVARLEHPHIVPLYDYWRDPDGAYLVMRYIRGGNLADRLVTDGPLDLAQAARLLDQVAGALFIAHRNRIVHQDIKPANILLDDDGNAYLTDFGIARDIEGNVNLAEDSSNTMHGSPKYISPELLRRKEITPRSDIYSLGLLMYEVITGRPPFQHEDMLQLLQMHIRNDIPSLQEVNPALPADLNAPLQQATVKDPMSRYDNVMQFAQDFQMIVANRNTGQTTPIPFPIDYEVEVTGPIDISNPYKGLKAFHEADADDFFGRDELVNRLKQSMTENGTLGRFLAIVGASGSGKSSVVRAGLIPAIRNEQIDGLPTQYLTTMTPGAKPMRALEGAILRIASRASINLIETLAKDSYDLHRVLNEALPDDGEMLLFIDQFEELFTLVEDEDKRRSFLDIIYSALTVEESRLRLIVTLRADYLDKPLNYGDWVDFFNNRLVLVPPMSAAELRDAIEKPAENAGLIFEPGLTNVIVSDFREQIGALPLLQYTLSELYERRKIIELTLEAYEQIGGISGALAKRADEIYNTLSQAQQEVSKLIFTRLVQVGDNANTRRRVLRTDLYSLDRDLDLIQSTIDTFGKYRLLTFDHEIGTRLPTVEIAHEAMLNSWNLLTGWIEDNQQALLLQSRLSSDASQWHEAHKDPSYLATGARLAEFSTLKGNDVIALTTQEQEYLNASIKLQQDRDLRRRRIQQAFMVLGATIFVVAVIAVILAWFANDQRNAAIQALDAEEVARSDAEQNAQESRARELAASSLFLAENFTDTAILLALESLEVENTFEGRNALLTSTLTQGRLARFLNGHDSFVRSVSVNSDGTQLASGGSNGTLILWDTASAQATHIIDAHNTRINSVTFNPDGSLIATSDTNGNLAIWDAETGENVERLSVGTAEIRALAFSPDGTLLAASNTGGQLVVWSTDNYSEVFSQTAHNGEAIYSLAFSPDSALLATGGGDNNIEIRSTESFELERIIEGHENWVFALAFSPDGTSLASGGADAFTILWDVASGESIWGFQAHRAGVSSLTFSDDGQLLITAGLDANIIYWDVATGSLQGNFATISQTEIRSIADYSNTLYVAGDNNTIFQYNIGFTPRYGTTVTTTDISIGAMALNPTDGAIAYASNTGSDDFNVYLLHDDTLETLVLHTALVTDFAWTNNRLVSVSLDRRAVLWEDSEVIGVLTLADSILSVAAHDSLLALGMNNGAIELWDISGTEDEWEQVGVLQEHNNRVGDLAFNATGTRLVSASRDETAIIWALGDEMIDSIVLEAHTGAVEAVAFSPDGNLIATASRDNTAILWDGITGEQLGPPLVAHDNWLNDLAFSPDGNTLVTVSLDRTVILWSVPEQRAYGIPFIGHADGVNAVDFADDGTYMLTAGSDGNIIRWETTLESWVQTACHMVNREVNVGELRDYFRDDYAPANVCSE